jgi:cytochrome bd-type quinol oxidase subunit 1
MNVTKGHWIFAGVFAVVFVLGMIYAYREDIKKRPDFFKGSFSFVLGVLLVLMTITVAKMIHRLGS